MPHFFAPHCLLATMMAATACLWSVVARAEFACPIQVEAPGADQLWLEKARETETLLSERGEIQHDCRSIRIEVQPEGNALLTFRTIDERIAVRLLHSPADIFPVVEALLVTLPVEKPFERPDMPPNTAKLPANQPSNAPAPLPRTPAITRPAPRILLRVLGGIRFGVDTGVLAPAIGLQATMHFEPWEIGIGGELNPLYLPLANSAPAGYLMRSFEGNLLVGRQVIQGRRVFRFGGTLGFSVVHEETDADPVTKGRVNIDAFQPRIGAYGGIVIPREGPFRFYLGLHGDMAIWGIREAGTLKRNLPNLPRFGMGLSLGMEIAP